MKTSTIELRTDLLTLEILKAIAPMRGQESVEDPIVFAKLFLPDCAATWYVTEFDGDDSLFGYAVINPGGGELGYFSLGELEQVTGPRGRRIERDETWRQMPLSGALELRKAEGFE